MRRAWPVLLLPLLAAAAPAPAAAPAGADYDLENKDWNGLSDLASIAQSRGFTVEAKTEIEWSDVGAGDVLFVLYPTVRLDAVQLATFVRQGGRVLLADDFGRSDDALARLGILRRSAAGLHPARVHEGNPNLPVALPLDETHPLARGVGELVTNHPAVFAMPDGPSAIFGFGKGEVVVAAGAVGSGRYVALSDPSVIINGMLAFDGNLSFAVNVLDYLAEGTSPVAPGRAPRVVVLTRDFTLTGQPQTAMDEARSSASVNDLLGDLGKWLDELNDYVAAEPVLRLSGWLAAIAILAVGTLAIPLRKVKDPDATFARVGDGQATFAARVAEFDDGRGDKNFAYPAAVLRENVEDRVAALPAEAQARAQGLLERVQRLPTRAELLTKASFVARREFVEVHDLLRKDRSTLWEHT